MSSQPIQDAEALLQRQIRSSKKARKASILLSIGLALLAATWLYFTWSKVISLSKQDQVLTKTLAEKEALVSQSEAKRKIVLRDMRILERNTKIALEKQAKLEVELQELAKSTSDQEALRNELIGENEFLAARNDKLNLAIFELGEVARRLELNASERKLVEGAENARFVMSIYSFDYETPKLEAMKNSLSNDGYGISRVLQLPERRDWLALKSTVFYYDNSSARKADIIASKLERVTGQSFEISRGNGLGVPKGQEKWTFFLHAIGD